MQNQSKIQKRLYLLFSTVVTVVILSWLFQTVELDRVFGLIVNMNKIGLVLFLLCSFSMTLARTLRYLLVLRNSGYHPGTVPLFFVTLVRNFFSDLLPARLGTLIYIYLVQTRLGIPFGAAASSFALAFLFDMIALVPLIVIAVFTMGAGVDLPTIPLLLAGGVLFMVSWGILASLPAIGRYVVTLLEKWKNAPGIIQNLIDWGEETIKELITAKKSGIYGKLLGWSVLVRMLKYTSYYVLLYAMIQPEGYTWSDLAPAKAFIGFVAPEMAASLPISGLGGFGLYQGVWSFVFELLGFPEQLAKETSLSHHIFTQAYGMVLGLFGIIALLLVRRKNVEHME